ncbi:MAG: hypothetical protein OXR66_09360 [Candidatus Woesearchaeota archaeon]|nr:hypothetical protein [Candidatus Woesearchaeota archaeon]
MKVFAYTERHGGKTFFVAEQRSWDDEPLSLGFSSRETLQQHLDRFEDATIIKDTLPPGLSQSSTYGLLGHQR